MCVCACVCSVCAVCARVTAWVSMVPAGDLRRAVVSYWTLGGSSPCYEAYVRPADIWDCANTIGADVVYMSEGVVRAVLDDLKYSYCVYTNGVISWTPNNTMLSGCMIPLLNGTLYKVNLGVSWHVTFVV